MRKMKYIFPWSIQGRMCKSALAVALICTASMHVDAESLVSNRSFHDLNWNIDTNKMVKPHTGDSTLLKRLRNNRDTLNVTEIKKAPYVSLQQYLKGNVAGVYVQENNGEPGTIQSMLIRGISTPVFSNKDVEANQPAVYMNGLPLSSRHPFVYDIKQYDVNPLGSANNLFAGIDLNNVKSIEVIKDPVRLAKLGPFAANGVIWIETNDAVNTLKNKEKVSLSATYGIVAPPREISPVNALYEDSFRQKFYDTYNLVYDKNSKPAYLNDRTDPNYYGSSNWADKYYNLGQQYNANASLKGGNENASLLFTVSSLRNSGIADSTDFQKHNMNFFVTMQPLKNFWMDAMISGTKTNRNRNRNLRDRYAETEYITDFSYPMAPGESAYNNFLTLDKETDDRNSVDYISGYLKLRYNKRELKTGAELLYDYNVDTRHVFWPSTLMESVSYVSDFTGTNRRVVLRGYARYSFDFGGKQQRLDVQLEGNHYRDLNKYNYTRGFDGTNDKYKTTISGGYRTYHFVDKEEGALTSSGLSLDYQYKKYLSVSAIAKYDGYSKMQADRRWLFTPAFSANWNIKNQLNIDNNTLSELSIVASWARIGRLIGSDRFAAGSFYTSGNMGWLNQWAIPSANTFATISRPYSSGWGSYGIDWPYSDKLNVGINTSFFNKRLGVKGEFYSNDDKNLLTAFPVAQEYGYSFQYLSGMHVNNSGVDLTLDGDILRNSDKLNWKTSINLNYNKNKLKALPNGQNELVIGDRKLVVGQAIDQFWVYENQGTYKSGVDGNLSMDGVSFQDGDAKWNDINRDNQITADDKVLKGHALPNVTGGMTNYFSYGKFDMSFQLFFALGQSALNRYDSNRYNFSYLDQRNDINAIKEVFFWQQGKERNDYPVYNPSSSIESYRADQDLFLEKASYIKLRSLSLGYKFGEPNNKKSHDLYVYLVANNIWTHSNFSGVDPELIDFNGYYRGYAQRIPLTMSMGVRYKF